MNFIDQFKFKLFDINAENFEKCSLELFEFQYTQNKVYRQYCDAIKRTPKHISSLYEIPFLPIEFFKHFPITSSKRPTQKIFKSSGTTSTGRSEHHVKDVEFYLEVCKRIFEDSFGALEEFQVLGLLPSYLEQGDSSLICMVDHFIKESRSQSGYFLNQEIASNLRNSEKKVLFGVSYALLDLPETQSQNLVCIETGGMKGRKKEIIKAELHQHIKNNLHMDTVWSEYGMTELMSQAYGKDGILKFPSWAKVLIREINDPFSYLETNKAGGINIIDLANIESCSFISTKDIGIMQKEEYFEILGRFDNSDTRGCSLLI